MGKYIGFLTDDEFIYTCVLLISLHSGFVIRCLIGKLKSSLSCLLGLALIYITCGIHIYHSVLVTLVTIALLQTLPQKISHVFVFIWCFSYLTVFRMPDTFGFPPPPNIANAVQLIITLRLVGLGFEVHDSWSLSDRIKTAKTDEIIQLYLQKEFCSIHPTSMEMFQYAFCFIGLFTGPYFKFRTYHDMLEWPAGIPRPSNKHLLLRLQHLPVYAFLFFIFTYFFSLDHVKTAKFYKAPFWYRFGAMVWIFCTFRFRMYCAWILAECLCMASMLGVYPVKAKSTSGKGPNDLRALKDWRHNKHAGTGAQKDQQKNNSWLDLSAIGSLSLSNNAASSSTTSSSSNVSTSAGHPPEYDFATITNIAVWGCEFTPTVREGMKSWNMTVQYWLAAYVHQRCPGPKSFRTLMTMLVSAYWHGLKPGYYLSFATMPLALLAETMLENVVYSLSFLMPPGGLWILRWLLKMRVFEYCAMGFLLLETKPTLRYWSSIYYSVHVTLLVVSLWGGLIHLVDQFAPTRLRAAQTEKQKAN